MTMHLILSTAISISLLFFANMNPNELNHSRWEGFLNVPDAMAAEMEFKNDSLFTYIGGDLVETNSFKINGDTLVLQKLTGMSSCDTLAAFYRYSIKDDVLKLKALQDNCEERKGAFAPEGYKRKK